MIGGEAGLRELVTRVDRAASYSSRDGAEIDSFIVHHAASGSLEKVLGMMRRGERGGLSATFVVDGDEIVSVAPVEARPHTSASAEWDARAITVETINSGLGDASGWPVSAASARSLARIAAWMAASFPAFRLDREHVIGHRELYERHGASYPTACPGGIDLDRVVRDAREILGAARAPDDTRNEKGIFMSLSEEQQLELLDKVRNIDHAIGVSALPVLSRLDVHRWREQQQPAVRDAVRGELVKAGFDDAEALAERIARRLASTRR